MACPNCGKPEALCVCSAIDPIATRLSVVILRHPQEQDRDLGTAGILARQITGAVLATGLSWPNLKRVLNRDADPRRWGVLYLGAAGQPGHADAAASAVLTAVSAKGQPLPDQAAAFAGLSGLILLDGSWSQAKALWWRNPWLLKCRRLVLTPRNRSRYGALRREPRRDALSTLEAAALTLDQLEGGDIQARLLAPFELLLARYREANGPRPPGP